MGDLSGQCRAASGVLQRPKETSWPQDGMPAPWSGWWCCPSGHSACHPSLMVMKVCSILAMVWGASPELGGLRRLPRKTTRAGSRPYSHIFFFALFPTSMLFWYLSGIFFLPSPLWLGNCDLFQHWFFSFWSDKNIFSHNKDLVCSILWHLTDTNICVYRILHT